MRRLLVVVTLASIAVTASAATGATTQTIRIVDRTPLVIEGRGFVAGRQVVVTVRAPGVSERRTRRANELGRFRVVIARLSLTGPLRCGIGVVIAARAVGQELVLWHPKLPDCPSPVRPPAMRAVSGA